MALLTKIILSIVAIAGLSLVGAAAWVMYDMNRITYNEATSSTDRVVREAQALAWKELTWRGSEGRFAKLAFPDWRSSDTLKVIAPGQCVSVTWTGEPTLTTCSGSISLGNSPPGWFVNLYRRAFLQTAIIQREIILNRKHAGIVSTRSDDMATTIRVWSHLQIVLGVASGMAICISVLSSVLIGYALRPAVVIVSGLRRLGTGNFNDRLPSFRSTEFNLIATAVNDLMDRLSASNVERAVLTSKLFVAQEVERLVIARDLHDEFGQCLTATAALANAIFSAGGAARPDIVEDAVNIRQNVARMMMSLQECISRLRPPRLEELGLVGCLENLVTTWNLQKNGQIKYRLETGDDITIVDEQVSVAIYRIAQECLTNASKHGCSSSVVVELSQAIDPTTFRTLFILVVEDDGGVLEVDVNTSSGHGILGIRERLAALGGDLLIGAGTSGLRVQVRIPANASISGQTA